MMSLAGPARRKCLAQAHRARWDSEVRMTNSRASLGRGDRGSGRGEGHRSVRLAASHDSSVRERRDCGGLALLDRKRTARIHRPADRPPGGARLLPQRSPGHRLHSGRPRRFERELRQFKFRFSEQHLDHYLCWPTAAAALYRAHSRLAA